MLSEKIINKKILWFFPTSVFKATVNDTKLVKDLKNKVTEMKNAKQGVFAWDNEHFETDDNLHENPFFKDLVDIVMYESNKIMDEQALIRDSHYITTMWATSTNKSYFHMMHNHPNCYLSGLIYLNAPPNCGKLIFRDPRFVRTAFRYDHSESNHHNAFTQTINPIAGDIYFWPHWLEHCVERHTEDYAGEEDRMMIAFNIMVKAEIKEKTAKLRI